MAKRETDEITIPAVAVDAFNEAVQQVAPNNQSTPTGKIFSETDVENIRKQEKDKMYKRLEEADARAKTMEEQLKVITGEREAAIRKAEETALKEADIRKQREFEELSAKELLLKQETEFTKKINDVENFS